MKLEKVPLDTMFVKLNPDEKETVFHKGKDGNIRVVVGTCNGWSSLTAMSMFLEEEAKFTPDMEVQPIIISFPMPCGD